MVLKSLADLKNIVSGKPIKKLVLAAAQDQRQVRLQFDLQFDLLALDDRPDQGNGPVDNVLDPGGAERLLFQPRKLQQIADDLSA